MDLILFQGLGEPCLNLRPNWWSQLNITLYSKQFELPLKAIFDTYSVNPYHYYWHSPTCCLHPCMTTGYWRKSDVPSAGIAIAMRLGLLCHGQHRRPVHDSESISGTKCKWLSRFNCSKQSWSIIQSQSKVTSREQKADKIYLQKD